MLAPLLAVGVGRTTSFGRTLEWRVYDSWFANRGPLDRPDRVVLVAIDLASEQSLGRYPWSRDWHTRLIRNLARAGAKVVAFDATFADPFPAQDSLLREIIDSTGITILGAKTEDLSSAQSVGFRLEGPEGALAGAPIGIVDNIKDPDDGVVREYGVVHDYPQGPVPQLGAAAVLRYLDLPYDSLIPTTTGWRLGSHEIPRSLSPGAMLIDFVGGPKAVSLYSYSSVVDDAGTDLGEWDMDEFDLLNEEGRFKDKIVFVGSTIPEHQDLHPTPFRSDPDAAGAVTTPGVAIHAQAADAILNDRFLSVLPTGLQLLWTLLLSLLVVAFAPRVRGLLGIVAALAIAGIGVGASWWMFAHEATWLWGATPAMGVVFTYAGTAAVLFVDQEKKAKQIRGMFSRYVDASVVDELIANPDLVQLGGEEREISVLFSDVAGFSTVSEKVTPTQLVALLNEYLTAMTSIVIAQGGTLDKYIGDAMMAEFGAPLPLADHAKRACRAALDMVAELARLREKWMAEGKPALFARVGINTGVVLVGNLGSAHVFDYTAMGDHVNLASRLEGANKPYGTSIMVSEFTWDQVKDEMYGRELDRIRVKGKNAPVCVYEVMGRTPAGIPADRADLIHAYCAALDLYRATRFEEARRGFEAITARWPEDGPSKLYVERCDEYLSAPPPAGWDGVYTMKTK